MDYCLTSIIFFPKIDLYLVRISLNTIEQIVIPLDSLMSENKKNRGTVTLLSKMRDILGEMKEKANDAERIYALRHYIVALYDGRYVLYEQVRFLSDKHMILSGSIRRDIEWLQQQMKQISYKWSGYAIRCGILLKIDMAFPFLPYLDMGELNFYYFPDYQLDSLRAAVESVMRVCGEAIKVLKEKIIARIKIIKSLDSTSEADKSSAEKIEREIERIRE